MQLCHASEYFESHHYLTEEQLEELFQVFLLSVGGADYDSLLRYVQRYAEAGDFATTAARFENDFIRYIAGSTDVGLSLALSFHLPNLFVSTAIVISHAFGDLKTADSLRGKLLRFPS